MTFDRREDRVLLGNRHRAQGVGKGGTNRALGKLLFGCLGEPSSDIYPTSHPTGLVSKLARDARLTQTFFVHQRADHPCLVERGEGARW